jgi:hypothetical protein
LLDLKDNITHFKIEKNKVTIFVKANLKFIMEDPILQINYLIDDLENANQNFLPQTYILQPKDINSNYSSYDKIYIHDKVKYTSNSQAIETVAINSRKRGYIKNKEELFLNTKAIQLFDGYFQSAKNFLGFDDKIKKLFGPNEEFISKIYQKYPQLNLENTVSIHIRFGDYKQNPHIHPSVSKEYLDKALEMIKDYQHLFLFGDDQEWLSQNFYGENITLINEEDYVDMWIMSLCKHNIIPNSTFSWWAAFLNKNNNKKIIVPSIWFGPNGPQNYYDMYESDWTKMDVVYSDGELKPKN